MLQLTLLTLADAPDASPPYLWHTKKPAVLHLTCATPKVSAWASKKFGGEYAKNGNILVRQRGTKIRAGLNVSVGSDDTLFATHDGIVSYTTKLVRRFTGHIKRAKYANVVPIKKAA